MNLQMGRQHSKFKFLHLTKQCEEKLCGMKCIPTLLHCIVTLEFFKQQKFNFFSDYLSFFFAFSTLQSTSSSFLSLWYLQIKACVSFVMMRTLQMQVAKQWLCEILLLLKRMIVVGAIRSYRVSNWKISNSDAYKAKMKRIHQQSQTKYVDMVQKQSWNFSNETPCSSYWYGRQIDEEESSPSCDATSGTISYLWSY